MGLWYPCNCLSRTRTHRSMLSRPQVMSQEGKIYALKRIKLKKADRATLQSYQNEIDMREEEINRLKAELAKPKTLTAVESGHSLSNLATPESAGSNKKPEAPKEPSAMAKMFNNPEMKIEELDNLDCIVLDH